MAKSIDAVIAALRVVLEEAEALEEEDYFDVITVNRWIAMLPGAWTGRWRSIMLFAADGSADRDAFIGHVRAALAYLENYRDNLQPGRFRWGPFGRRPKKLGEATSNVIDLPAGKKLH